MLFLHVTLLGQPASEIFYWMTCTGNARRNPFDSMCSKSNNFFFLVWHQSNTNRKVNRLYTNWLETRKLILLPQKFPARLSTVLRALHRLISVTWRMWLRTNFDFNLKTKKFSINRYSIDLLSSYALTVVSMISHY